MAEKISVIDDEAQSSRSLTGWGAKIITLIAIVYVALEVAGLQFIVIDPWIFMALVMILVFILAYLTVPYSPKSKGGPSILDWVLEPQNPFEPEKRRGARKDFVLVVVLVGLPVGAFVYFNFWI